MDRDDYELIGILLIGILAVIVIVALLYCVGTALFFILDVVNGVPNVFEMHELVGIFILVAAVFGGSVSTVKSGD